MTHANEPGPQMHGPGKTELALEVNGIVHELFVEPRRTLIDALRVNLGLTGTKQACGQGNCGACTVHLDGEPVYSCLLLAVECAGQAITTIEGLREGAALHQVQQAFVEHDALQCGFCTPGQIMAAVALLARNPHPTEADVLDGMAGNLCRCGAYRGIIRAVLAASENMRT
jgi:xanthine dehydrogenase YagT iron-sulfur-binding subunit